MPANKKRHGRSVLIVEDDPGSRAALVAVLSRLGYDTVPVASVAEGVAKLDGQHCAILDMNLPDGLGTVVLERIRNEKRTMRVAVTTGTTDEAVLEQVQTLQADLILRKPIHLNTLIEWLDRQG